MDFGLKKFEANMSGENPEDRSNGTSLIRKLSKVHANACQEVCAGHKAPRVSLQASTLVEKLARDMVGSASSVVGI